MEGEKIEQYRRSERSRKMTQKGAEFTLESKNKNRERCFKILLTLSDNLQKLLLSSEDKETIRRAYSEWLDKYEEFLVSQDEVRAWLSTSDQVPDEERFQKRDEYLMDLKSSVEDWFTKHSKSVVIDNNSVSSSGSRKSSYSQAKLEESQRKAELEARAASFQEKKQIEEAKLQLKLKEEELDIKTALKICDERTKIIEQLEKADLEVGRLSEAAGDIHLPLSIVTTSIQDPIMHVSTSMKQSKLSPYAPVYSSVSRPLPTCETVNHINRSICTMTPGIPYVPTITRHSTPYVPVSSYETSRQPQTQVYSHLSEPTFTTAENHHNTDDLFTVARELNKPKADIQKFEGNPMDYQRFIRQFNTKVCANTSSYEERLNFLLQFTRGEANRIVTGYSHLDAERGYLQALDELKDRYGDPDVVAHTYVKKALDWPAIKPDNSKALDSYAIFLTECQFAVNNVNSARVLEYSENMKLLIRKLPFYLQEKWRNVVYELKDRKQAVTFQNLVNFVRKEAKKANDPIYSSSSAPKRQNERVNTFSRPSRNFATKTMESLSSTENHTAAVQYKPKFCAFVKPCIYCEGSSHSLEECKNIMKLPLKDRYAVLKMKGLCFSCLKSGHQKGVCQRKSYCIHCKRCHPSILHLDPRQSFEPPDQNNNRLSVSSASVSSAAHMGAGELVRQALPIIPVRLKSRNSDKYIYTYAFLDSGSTATFFTEKIANLLHIEGKKTLLNLTTMGQQKTENCYILSGLEITDVNGDNPIDLPPIYTQPELPVSRKDIISLEDLQRWPHLSDIHIDRIPIDSDIGLLIGVNVPKAMEPWDIIPSKDNGPFAMKTILGWVINGPIDTVPENGIFNTFVRVNRIDARLEEQIRYQFNHDFCERTIDDVPEPSKEDKTFLELVKKSAHFEDGHYIIDLPFKSKTVTMPNNRKQAEQRLISLSRKFENNIEFCDSYKAFMDKIISEGYAQQVPTENLQQNDGRVWYLPHHGVFHPKKNKLRVVFDCVAKFKGTSLNDQLLQGPNLTNTLIGTLIRFREDEIAVMGDVDSMFYQVRVPLQDASFLRFLWWKDGDPSKSVTEYQMVVHLFGATSSPSCANFCLRKTTQDWKGYFSEETVNTVLKNFYVDDCLKSVKSVNEAVILVKDLQRLLDKGGFHISKWISNSRDVMNSIPVSERAKEVKEVQWCVESDFFNFKLELNKQPLTRREILSMVSSVYDPLGFLAPFVLKAKCILQEICKMQLGWDDRIPDDLVIQWNHWYQDLQKLEDFKVNRCIKPFGFDPVITQLHHFSDASEIGYGTVSYLLLENIDGERHCSFIMGKSRVTPLKQTAIPRLELTAASYNSRQNQQDVTDRARHAHRSRYILDRQYGSITLYSEQNGKISYFRS
nr:uncharacterized protein LOC105341007 [Crassostrea gigas]